MPVYGVRGGGLLRDPDEKFNPIKWVCFSPTSMQDARLRQVALLMTKTLIQVHGNYSVIYDIFPKSHEKAGI